MFQNQITDNADDVTWKNKIETLLLFNEKKNEIINRII